MAVRRNKDKEIEDLKARNEYLEKKSRLVSSWRGMSDKQRLIISLLYSASIVALVLFISFTLLKTTKSPIESYSDYERVLSSIDKREWKIAESGRKNLLSLFPSASGKIRTIKESDTLSLFIYMENEDRVRLNFTYKDGRILSLYKGMIMEVEYSETVYGGGRTLSLLSGGGKIVFKEKR